MNNRCNSCAKFLSCNRKECKKVSFVEAEILDRPRKIKRNSRSMVNFGISIKEAEESLQKAMQKYNKLYHRNYNQEGGSYDNSKSR